MGVDIDRIPLATSRDNTWLHSLWGNVSTRNDIIARRFTKQQRQLEQERSQEATPGSTSQESASEQERERPPSHLPVDESERDSSPSTATPGEKRPRQDDYVIKTYTPQWGVLSNDAIVASAPPSAKEVGPDLCRHLMLALLSLAVPWAAAVIDKVAGFEVRAIRAEESLRNAEAEVERLGGQAFSLQTVWDQLRAKAANLRGRHLQRNDQLKAARKAIQKSQKLPVLTEERCFQMGYDEAVIKAHDVGLDHNLLLAEGELDPVAREGGQEEVLAISSGEDEDLSD